MITVNSHLEDSPNDLNANDSRQASKIDGVDEGAIQNTHSKIAKQDCVHEMYRRSSVDALRTDDVLPIKYARVRFLNFIIDHFIDRRIRPVSDSEADYTDTTQYEQDNLRKRKSREVIYEGDPLCSNPLIYVANIYQTLVTEADARLACLDGFQQMTIGVVLEAAEGLYRRIAQKFPEEGFCKFKRRELITPGYERRWFPELVVQEEKEIRFVVVNGLDIVEQPETVSVIDAEWFMKLTGRSKVSISGQEYKFYTPRHKDQHVVSPLPSIPGLPPHVSTQNSSPMAVPHVLSSIPEDAPHAQPPLGSSLPRAPCSAKSMESKVHMKPPSKFELHKDLYTRELPNFMVPFITAFYDDIVCGYCGFRAIAEEVGLGDDNGWRGVLRDLFLELVSNSDVYEPVLTRDSVEKILKALAFWTQPIAPPGHRFSIHGMGHIVATWYFVVLVVLGQEECATFLPLNRDWDHSSGEGNIRELCLVSLSHQKGFISVTVDENIPMPMPPIHPLWADHHHTSVDGLDRLYADRIQRYEWFQTFM